MKNAKVFESNVLHVIGRILERNDIERALALAKEVPVPSAKRQALALVIAKQAATGAHFSVWDTAMLLPQGFDRDCVLAAAAEGILAAGKQEEQWNVLAEALNGIGNGDGHHELVCRAVRSLKPNTAIRFLERLSGWDKNAEVLAAEVESLIRSVKDTEIANRAVLLFRLLRRPMRDHERVHFTRACLEQGDWNNYMAVFADTKTTMGQADVEAFVAAAISKHRLEDAARAIAVMSYGDAKTAAILSLVEAFAGPEGGAVVASTNATLDAIGWLDDAEVRAQAYSSAIAAAARDGMYAVMLRFAQAAGRKPTHAELVITIKAIAARHGLSCVDADMLKGLDDGPEKTALVRSTVAELLRGQNIARAAEVAKLVGDEILQEGLADSLPGIMYAMPRSFLDSLAEVDTELGEADLAKLIPQLSR